MERAIETATQKMINHLKGKYIKRILVQLEAQGPVKPEVRKAVLDGLNDMARDIQKELGYEVVE